jgi:thioredoxin 1
MISEYYIGIENFLNPISKRSLSTMSEHIVKITDQNFEQEVLKAGVPVVLDFSANWCGPCKAIAPILVKVCTLDVDESQATAQKYRIFSIPTLLLFKDGNVVGQSVGLVPMEKIEELIGKAL